MTIYCSIDTHDLDSAVRMADHVVPAGCGIKLGMEFFNSNGPAGVTKLREKYPEASLFIDLKYHDIPNTVAGALRAITRLGPDFLNVHASGGAEMMRQGLAAMKDESHRAGVKMPKLLAVTVLTSMDDEAVTSVGWQLPVADQVKRLALLTKNTGLNGVVCSPLEIKMVRETCGPGFITMVPGIRPVQADDDQKRTMTPKEAMAAGATHLVIGRPITQSRDPGQTARDIIASLV